MGYNYHRLRQKREENFSYWTSYSDLFMMLSSVFLLLYVTTSLRSGTFGIQKNAEHEKLRKEAEDLREQIRVYNTLRDEQVTQSSDDEKKVYTNLMDKLSLLKEQAKDEKDQLRKRAAENEQKEDALNRYQQIIRNIINANVLAKAQIKRREDIIHTKEHVIQTQAGEIRTKEQVIAQNNQQIEEINNELANKIQRLRETQRQAHSSKEAMEKKIQALRQQTASEIEALNQKNEEAAEQLTEAQNNLSSTQAKLAETSASLEKAASDLESVKNKSAEEKADLVSKLEGAKGAYEAQLGNLRAEGEKLLAAQRGAFEKELAKQKLSAGEIAKREGEFRKKAEGEAKALQGKIGELQGKIGDSDRRLQKALADQGRALSAVKSLEHEKDDMARRLKQAKDLADARKNLANAIKRNFQKAGIQAAVDPGTGDVTLAFPDDYFETGRSELTQGMQARVRKFIPAYTQSLFSDPKTAEKISNIEIIGFASSTFKGKYVNPQSLKPQDRDAIDYNLRLSFTRANSIFKYIFDTKKLTYSHQKDLLPMVKVVGRGYLPEGKQGSDIPEGMPEEEFCRKYNCKKAQKVVIKFNLKN